MNERKKDWLKQKGIYLGLHKIEVVHYVLAGVEQHEHKAVLFWGGGNGDMTIAMMQHIPTWLKSLFPDLAPLRTIQYSTVVNMRFNLEPGCNIYAILPYHSSQSHEVIGSML